MKFINYIATSNDGFIAGFDHNLDFLEHGADLKEYGFDKFMDKFDSVLMGRNTFEVTLKEMEKHNIPWPYVGKKCFVASNTLKEADNCKVISGSFDELVKVMEQDGAKETWIVGGAKLLEEAAQRKLFSYCVVFKMPKSIKEGIKLKLPGYKPASSKMFDNVEVTEYKI